MGAYEKKTRDLPIRPPFRAPTNDATFFYFTNRFLFLSLICRCEKRAYDESLPSSLWSNQGALCLRYHALPPHVGGRFLSNILLLRDTEERRPHPYEASMDIGSASPLAPSTSLLCLEEVFCEARADAHPSSQRGSAPSYEQLAQDIRHLKARVLRLERIAQQREHREKRGVPAPVKRRHDVDSDDSSTDSGTDTEDTDGDDDDGDDDDTKNDTAKQHGSDSRAPRDSSSSSVQHKRRRIEPPSSTPVGLGAAFALARSIRLEQDKGQYNEAKSRAVQRSAAAHLRAQQVFGRSRLDIPTD